MSTKRTLARFGLVIVMTVLIVLTASLTFAYVVPIFIHADIAGVVSSSVGTIQRDSTTTSENLVKVHEKNLLDISDDTSGNDSTKIVFSIPLKYAKSGTVTRIVDGDTLDIDNVRVRLALVNTPEKNQEGYKEAKDFTSKTCPKGTLAIYDIDDSQTGGSYGRKIANVWCYGHLEQTPVASLNELLIENDHAKVLVRFCSVSEFADESWAKGC